MRTHTHGPRGTHRVAKQNPQDATRPTRHARKGRQARPTSTIFLYKSPCASPNSAPLHPPPCHATAPAPPPPATPAPCPSPPPAIPPHRREHGKRPRTSRLRPRPLPPPPLVEEFRFVRGRVPGPSVGRAEISLRAPLVMPMRWVGEAWSRVSFRGRGSV